MSSNPISSFFTRLRRDRSRDRSDPKKRYSVPVFNHSGDDQPPTFHNDPHHPLGSPPLRSSENKSPKNAERNKKDVARKDSKAATRKGGALSFLLCVSRNADTLDRQNGLPPNPNKKVKGETKNPKDDAKSNEVINSENKKAHKQKKLAKGWFSVDNVIPPQFLANSEPFKENIYGPVYQPTRGPSQGVRYRVDGTLEKPYVFPSGFTFGPEGRKLKLRRSSPENNEHAKSKSDMKLNRIAADVHPTDNDEFDADQAFYLRFDSPRQNSKRNRYSMPNVQEAFSPDDYFSIDKENFSEHFNPIPPDGSLLDSFRDEQKSKNKNDKSNRSSKRSRYKKNRYSMPPKNEDFVYMGSFENLHLCDSLEKKQNLENERKSNRDSKREKKKNRYSMPPKNPDCVYMGSFENINFQFNAEKDRSVPLSVHQKDASLSRSYSSTASNNKLDEVDSKPAQMLSFSRRRQDQKNDNCVPENNVNSRQKEIKENEDDHFDETLPLPARSGPFIRDAARSSGMPGNKRSLAPPPAVFAPVISGKPRLLLKDSGDSLGQSSDRSAGGKQFVPPPPPNHTPSWEEMEKVQVRLSEMARGCHKGSQADISSEDEVISMEERDRTTAQKTAQASAPSTLQITHSLQPVKENKEIIYDVPRSTNVLKLPTAPPVILSTPLDHPGGVDSSNSSQDSDNVFESPKQAQKTKPTFKINDENKTSPNPKSHYSNVDVQFSSNLNPMSSLKKLRNDYEYMYLCSTPQISLAKESQAKSEIALNSLSFDFENFIPSSLPGEGTTEEVNARRAAVVTSTPKLVRKPTATENEAKREEVVTRRPKPLPRTRSSATKSAVLTDVIVIPEVKVETGESHASLEQLVTPSSKNPPVPKKRTNLSYSSSACSQSEAERKLSVFNRESRRSRELRQAGRASDVEHNKSNARTCQPTSTANEGSHVYEEMVLNPSPQTIINGDQTTIYDEMRPGPAKRKEATQNKPLLSLSPMQTMKLASSPLARRRADYTASPNRPLYTGLSTSTSDLTDVFSSRDRDYANWMALRFSLVEDEDDDCAADDELSACNDEDDDEFRRGSLRKWASADDIIRSGSIVDRSMILAKRRRLRKRQKKAGAYVEKPNCQPPSVHHLQPRPDDKQASTPARLGQLSNGADVGAVSKDHARAMRGTGQERERRQLNHTDSGHDSDIVVSPCVSPSVITQSYVGNEEDPNRRRQSSAGKKSWETRLQKLQWQRKLRSRENLSESLV